MSPEMAAQEGGRFSRFAACRFYFYVIYRNSPNRLRQKSKNDVAGLHVLVGQVLGAERTNSSQASFLLMAENHQFLMTQGHLI